MEQRAGEMFVGGAPDPQFLALRRANRHGLIAGATGTGKTVTLQILAEGFSAAGVPVFMADVKGDLSGLSQTGTPHPKLSERALQIGLTDYVLAASPTVFWDLYGEQGHPVRATISDMGPLLLSRLLGLNETQEGVLNIAFRIADENSWLLLDLKDLRSMLLFVGESASEISMRYGNVSKSSIGAIQRRLLTLENEGVDQFFGEPALELADLMRTTYEGRGFINILNASRLMNSPKLYGTFLLWLLSELFEELPEVGDPEQPVLVFFFDEAHLLFDDAPKALVDRVEQVVRLIRSKGVGVYFVTQSPLDLPEGILGQLGNRFQHALRAFTPKDQRAVRAAAETFRTNPAFDAVTAIGELGVGEALVSTLDMKGVPSVVERTLIRPPASRLGPATDDERRKVIGHSPVAGRYEDMVDRESAYEHLQARASAAQEAQAAEAAQAKMDKEVEAQRRYQPPSSPPPRARKSNPRPSRGRQTMVEAMTKSVLRSVGSSFGRQLVRGILGGLFKGR